MDWRGNFDRLFIGGDWVTPSSKDTIEVISPATEECVAVVPAASKPDVERAVSSARAAFDSGPGHECLTPSDSACCTSFTRSSQRVRRPSPGS
jgi:Aldehyde dehydrogenase family